MLRFFWLDLKRIFSRKATLALAVLAPVVTLLVFSLLIAPVFFSGRLTEGFNVALLNLDDSEITDYFISHLSDSMSVKGIVRIVEVSTEEQGFAMIDEGEAACFMIIPAGLNDSLSYREPVVFRSWSSPKYPLESELINNAVESGLVLVSRTQAGLDVLFDHMYLEAADRNTAYDWYNSLVGLATKKVLMRSDMLDDEVRISPLGKFLPVEYYTAAIFAIFLTLGVLPMAGYGASDFSSPVLHRGMLAGRPANSFLLARMLSGAVFLTVIMIPAVLVGILANGLNSLFAGNPGMLFVIVPFCALMFSGFAVLLSLLFKTPASALQMGFWLALLMIMAGGVLLPPAYLPGAVARIGAYSPAGAIMRMMASALFDYDAASVASEGLKVLAFGLACAGLSALILKRRAGR